MDNFDADVIVVGAGPAGLMLAGELRLAGVSTIIVDRLAEPMQQSRALGFSARTIEEFGQRGLLPRFGELETIPIGHFGGLPIDYRIVEGGNFGVRGVPQSFTETILADWASGLGVTVRRGHEVVGLQADDNGVDVELNTPEGPQRLRAAYVVGCDGGRSAVRRLSGIEFPGTDATIEMKMADVAGVQLRLRPTGEIGPAGMVVVLPLGPHATRVVVYERNAEPRKTHEAPSFAEVADAFERVTGEDIRGGKPLWTSFFTDASRQALSYRQGRVFLAGDAAHIHLPIGAQGISAGVGDVVNLGWKLAAEIKGHAPEGLLDTYQSERHPVGARIVANTLVQRSLYLGGDEMQPLRDVFSELVVHEEVQRHLVGMVTGLDTRYEGGPQDHPLLGRRLPDQELLVGDEKTTTYELLHTGRGVLLDLNDDAELRSTAAAWADRVDVVTATRHDSEAPQASLLVRPDGYIAWVSPTGSSENLADALTRWFGNAAQ
ncbi:FAD-dependent monooxygenase [Kitasatospora sp. MAA4]|uniref:FAD-dependent monooxygenase n=1 Tax=Kitasatospora sp. MAA4 TaxID=3035093 RepID=UPI00247382EF|nr:FAD-dependent monooxygenase [Kitasatospora sp. MAA4]